MFADEAKKGDADMAAAVKVTYVDRESNALAGTMTFEGKDLAEAMDHASRYRDAHHDLQEVTREVVCGS